MIRFNRGFVLQDAGGLESDRWAGYREKVFDQVVDKVQLFHFPVYIFPSLLVSDLGGTALDPARLTGPNFDVRCSMFNVGRSRTSDMGRISCLKLSTRFSSSTSPSIFFRLS